MRSRGDFEKEMVELLEKSGVATEGDYAGATKSLFDVSVVSNPQEFRFKMPYTNNASRLRTEKSWVNK